MSGSPQRSVGAFLLPKRTEVIQQYQNNWDDHEGWCNRNRNLVSSTKSSYCLGLMPRFSLYTETHPLEVCYDEQYIVIVMAHKVTVNQQHDIALKKTPRKYSSRDKGVLSTQYSIQQNLSRLLCTLLVRHIEVAERIKGGEDHIPVGDWKSLALSAQENESQTEI